jgi:hypothetical protein
MICGKQKAGAPALFLALLALTAFHGPIDVPTWRHRQFNNDSFVVS